jgi:hypothetical protein
VAAEERPGFQLTAEILTTLQTRGVNGALPTVADFDGKLRLAGALFNEALAVSADLRLCRRLGATFAIGLTRSGFRQTCLRGT